MSYVAAVLCCMCILEDVRFKLSDTSLGGYLQDSNDVENSSR